MTAVCTRITGAPMPRHTGVDGERMSPRPGVARRDNGADGFRPARSSSAARQGPRRRPLLRAAGRGRPGARGRASPAPTSAASFAAPSASRRTPTCSPGASSARRRCCEARIARCRRSASRWGCRASARSRRASPARTACRRPPTARRSRRRLQHALVPACVAARLRAPATPHVSRRQRPERSGLVSLGDLVSNDPGGHHDQDRQRPSVGQRPG